MLAHDEKILLEALAQGEGGISPRLARRAWLVLQDAARINPILTAQAVGAAGRVQERLLQYRAMGPVGLVDAPRSGRSPEVSAQAFHQLDKIFARSSDEDALRALRDLPRPVREAIWRSNRLQGGKLERSGRWLDIPVPVPAGLHQLAALYASGNLIVIVLGEVLAKQLDELGGHWLSVSTGISWGEQQGRPDHQLITALNLRLIVATPGQQGSASSRSPDYSEKFLMQRFMLRAHAWVKHYPGQLTVLALANDAQPAFLLHWLGLCRKQGWWAAGSKKYPGQLRNMGVIPFAGSRAQALQRALVQALPDTSPEILGDLLDALRTDRSHIFCWVRDIRNQ